MYLIRCTCIALCFHLPSQSKEWKWLLKLLWVWFWCFCRISFQTKLRWTQESTGILSYTGQIRQAVLPQTPPDSHPIHVSTAIFNCYWLFPRSVFNSPQKTSSLCSSSPSSPPQKKKSIMLLFSLYLYLEIVPEHNIQTETRFKAKSYCSHFLKKVTWTWMLPDNIYHQPSENSYLILFFFLSAINTQKFDFSRRYPAPMLYTCPENKVSSQTGDPSRLPDFKHTW